MSYVTHLETNVKGKFASDFGPKTLLVGPNASHKSGAVAALELALTGRCSELGAMPAELMTLAPSGAKSLYAAVALSDGTEARFEIRGSSARASKPVWTAPNAVVLSREVSDLLRAEPKRLRLALLAMIGADLTGEAVAGELPLTLRSAWLSVFASAAGDSTIDRLLDAVAQVRSKSRFSALELGERPVCPSDSEIEAARGELTAPVVVQTSDHTAIDRKIKAHDALDLIRQAERILRASRGRCLCCGSAFDDVSARIRLSEKSAALYSIIAEMPDDAAAIAPSTARPTSDRLESLLAAKAAAKAYDSALASANALAAEARDMKAILQTLDRVVADRLAKTIHDFEFTASKAIEPRKIKVQLYDGDRQVCRVGIEQAGRFAPYRALSGAERYLFLSGLLSAWRSPAQTRVAVIDDVWLDSDHLHSVAQSLCRTIDTATGNAGPTQAIVATVVGQGQTVHLEGWKTVHCGESCG